ncbi:MAG: ABC transporter ATP-binding protein [Acidimicrobiales bacterium]
MPPAAIEVDDLGVWYGELRAVDGVSFTVVPGEVVALLGPNGAGKTTTVETLEGFRRPDTGRVRVLGLDPVAAHRSVVARLGVMPQTPGIQPGIRPAEVLRLYASYYERPEDPEALLERVGLAERRHATFRQLSGGEQQRLSLALALVGRPGVAFLDEPTAGVDVAGRQVVRQIVGELRDAGVAVLVTTHDLDDAERSADRLVIIDRGRVLAAGTPAELMRADDGDEIRFAAPDLDTAGLGVALGSVVDELAPGEYRVRAAPTPTNVAALTAWLAERDLPLGHLRAGRQRLEDVFLRLTRDAER